MARIRHAELGELMAVELEPFDYTFVLESGIRIEVNAEEEPGKPYDDTIRVTDWSLVVTMEPHGDWEQLSWEEFASRLRPRPRMRPAMDPVPAKMCMPTGATSWTWRLP